MTISSFIAAAAAHNCFLTIMTHFKMMIDRCGIFFPSFYFHHYYSNSLRFTTITTTTRKSPSPPALSVCILYGRITKSFVTQHCFCSLPSAPPPVYRKIRLRHSCNTSPLPLSLSLYKDFIFSRNFFFCCLRITFHSWEIFIITADHLKTTRTTTTTFFTPGG